MKIFVFARLHARPGKRSEVHQAMFDVQAPTRAEPGCLSYGAFQSLRDSDEFYIHTCWQDMAAFDHHAGLPHTTRFVEVVEPLLDHPFKVTLSRAPLVNHVQPPRVAQSAARGLNFPSSGRSKGRFALWPALMPKG